MEMSSRLPTQASAVIVHLLKGIIYSDIHQEQWQALLNFQAGVRDYLSVIGLDVVVDEAEGYAFLRQRPEIEESAEKQSIPRLIQRRPLSFPISLLCVLLRRKLSELDASGGETRLILSHAQIVDMVRVFLPESTNEAKIIDQIDQYVQRLIDYGFLRKLKSEEPIYEVKRILKALVDA